jgi:hypothetical protein
MSGLREAPVGALSSTARNWWSIKMRSFIRHLSRRGRRSLLRCPYVSESTVEDLPMTKVNYPCGWLSSILTGAEKARRHGGRLYGAAG